MRMITLICLGAACLLAAAPAASRAQSGYALEFDGDDDWVEISDPLDVTGPLTLEGWFRVDTFDGGRIMSNRTGSDGYEIDVMSNGSLRFTTGAYARCMSSISSRLGEWVHFAVTWEGPTGGEIRMYVDGELVQTESLEDPIVSSAGNLAIGCSGSGSYFFDGAIDEIRIFDAVVDGTVIREWMTRRIGPGHPDYAHLQGAWSFEEGSGQATAGEVAGRDGRLGDEAVADAADPLWVNSGMVGVTSSTWGGLKGIYRP